MWGSLTAYQRKKKKKKKKKKKMKKKILLCIGKTNNTNSDVTTSSTKVLCRAARIAETITAGCPTYIKFTQAVNKTTQERSYS